MGVGENGQFQAEAPLLGPPSHTWLGGELWVMVGAVHPPACDAMWCNLKDLLSWSFSLTAYPTCFPLTQFTCNNGRCININWRCDNGKSLFPFTRPGSWES